MTKVLTDIRAKKHVKNICYANCKENGETFNQIPHQCRYYSGSQRYNRLLEYHRISTFDSPDGGISSKQNIKDFCLRLILLEDYKEDYNFGYRKKEDIIELEKAVETL